MVVVVPHVLNLGGLSFGLANIIFLGLKTGGSLMTGQTAEQRPQDMHSPTSSALAGETRMTSTGHIKAQAPQSLQSPLEVTESARSEKLLLGILPSVIMP